MNGHYCCDSGEECCKGDCCDPDDCKSCIGGSCVMCNGDPDMSCCDGECFNFYTHMCCGGNICRQPCCDDWDCKHCVEGTCLPCLSKPSDYEELMECSGTIVDDPDTEPETNGCSVPYFICYLFQINCNNPAEEECGEASSFLEACDAHDTCYQTCGSDRIGSCDASFSSNLWLVCNPLSGQCRVDCLWWRDKYVGAVLLFGEGAWEDDQVNACACCDCE